MCPVSSVFVGAMSRKNRLIVTFSSLLENRNIYDVIALIMNHVVPLFLVSMVTSDGLYNQMHLCVWSEYI